LAEARGPLTRLLSSPRRRRRLGWASVLLAVAGGIAFVAVNYANTGTALPEHFTNQPVQRVAPPPRAAKLSGEDQNAARAVAEHFIDTAVLRQRIDESWEISAPSLHQGMTREQWRSGNIPVTPYPANAVGEIKYRVDWSGEDRVYLKIAIVPKPKSTANGQAFDMGLERLGPAQNHRWLVDYWVPSGIGSPNPAPAAGNKSAAAQTPELESRIPAAWIMAPIGLLVFLLLAVPLTLMLRGWHRARRAERLYRETS
jgi:hypothetical protein